MSVRRKPRLSSAISPGRELDGLESESGDARSKSGNSDTSVELERVSAVSREGSGSSSPGRGASGRGLGGGRGRGGGGASGGRTGSGGASASRGGSPRGGASGGGSGGDAAGLVGRGELEDVERASFRVDIVDVADIDSPQSVSAPDGDDGESDGDFTRVGVDVVGNGELVIEGFVDELNGELCRVGGRAIPGDSNGFLRPDARRNVESQGRNERGNECKKGELGEHGGTTL